MKNIKLTDEEINKIADKITEKIDLYNIRDMLRYGIVARYETCSVHFSFDTKGNDIFIIKDNDGNIIGKFIEISCDSIDDEK